jgi:hypothetical protein
MVRAVMAACLGFLLVSAAHGFGLTDDDFEFLAGRQIERHDPVIERLSPRERATLHAVINDSRTKDNLASRSKAVDAALEEHRAHQLWETMNPGRLWDAPKHGMPGRQ